MIIPLPALAAYRRDLESLGHAVGTEPELDTALGAWVSFGSILESFLAEGTFELAMIATSILIAAISLGSSYRVHRKLNPILMMISGGVILVFNFFGHESHSELMETLHPYIAAFAGLMIASAHWVNMRLCSSCDVCAHDHEHTSPSQSPA